MIRVFAENENRDIYIGASNQLAIIDGIEAVAQATKAAVEKQLDEAIYSQGSGMPTDSTVWSGTPNLNQFDFFARRQILAVDGVINIVSFESEINGEAVQYRAEIKTIYGQVAING